MEFSVSCYANDGRPVPPMHVCNVTGTLDDAKAVVDEMVRTAQLADGAVSFTPWRDAFGSWFRECKHFGYSVSDRD